MIGLITITGIVFTYIVVMTTLSVMKEDWFHKIDDFVCNLFKLSDNDCKTLLSYIIAYSILGLPYILMIIKGLKM